MEKQRSELISIQQEQLKLLRQLLEDPKKYQEPLVKKLSFLTGIDKFIVKREQGVHAAVLYLHRATYVPDCIFCRTHLLRSAGERGQHQIKY